MVRPSQFSQLVWEKGVSDGVWQGTVAEGELPGRGLIVEYCAGNGCWAAYRAQREPSLQWVAVECKRGRVAKIWSKRRNLSLNNLLIIWGEADEVTRAHFADGSVAQVYIHFPDPWPKRRHAKHRLMQAGFIAQLQRILQPGGRITFVTDDLPYAQQAAQLLQVPIEPFDPAPDYGTSYFEGLWRSKGKPIYQVIHQVTLVTRNVAGTSSSGCYRYS
jgi:tRNA (guanine-N7-)-methyltransferase